MQLLRLRSNFVEDLGEDFFGTRELGLDASAMSVPSRLFTGEEEPHRLTNGSVERSVALNSLEVPQSLTLPLRLSLRPFGATLPYPPPPPFAPLSLSSIPTQIGLLRPFYQSRFQQRATLPSPPPVSVPLPPVAPTEALPETAPPSTNGVGEEGSEAVPITIDEPVAPPLPTPPSPTLPPYIPDDVFDSILLRRLGPQAEIPATMSAAAKRKGEVEEGDSPAKKKKKSKEDGVG